MPFIIKNFNWTWIMIQKRRYIIIMICNDYSKFHDCNAFLWHLWQIALETFKLMATISIMMSRVISTNNTYTPRWESSLIKAKLNHFQNFLTNTNVSIIENSKKVKNEKLHITLKIWKKNYFHKNVGGKKADIVWIRWTLNDWLEQLFRFIK